MVFLTFLPLALLSAVTLASLAVTLWIEAQARRRKPILPDRPSAQILHFSPQSPPLPSMREATCQPVPAPALRLISTGG